MTAVTRKGARDPGTIVALVFIVLLAAALRVPGVGWGLPDSVHPDYSYHPDEAPTTLWAEWLSHGQLISKQFIYGGTLHYSVLNAYRYYGKLLSTVLNQASPLADTLLVGRLFVVFFSVLTVVLVFVIGHRLFGRATGLLAALFLALAPVHVFLAQNVRLDELATLLATTMLYLAVVILQGDPERDRKMFTLVGLLAGVSLALRYPIAVFGILPLLACWLRDYPTGAKRALARLFGGRFGILVVTTVVAYALASPHTVIHPEMWLAGMKVTWGYETAAFPDAIGRGPGIYQYGWLTMREALGPALYIVAVLGLVLAAWRRGAADWLLLAAVLPYFAMLTAVSWVVVRYTMPIIPALALLAAAFIVSAARSGGSRVPLAGGVAVLVVVWTLAADLAFLKVESTPDVRDVASDWLASHIRKGTPIIDVEGYLGDVYFSPPVPADYRRGTFILSPASKPHGLGQMGGAYILVVNEYIYKNMDRLGPRHPSPAAYALQQTLDGGKFQLLAELKKPVSFFGIDFGRWFTSQDYQIINPGIRIYAYSPSTAAPVASKPPG